VVSSFGKTYHVTGWKTGYVVAPPALSAELRKVHQYVNFCGVTPCSAPGRLHGRAPGAHR
jgi:methionine aminotransferase